MTKEEKIFEFMKAIAPIMVKEGVELQKRIVAAGGNPDNCTIGDMDILDAQAHSAREWAEAFAKASE